MQAGNVFYKTPQDIPYQLPILSSLSVMLLPGGFVPLTISEPRIIQMVEDVMQGNRLLGLMLVKLDSSSATHTENEPTTGLWNVGSIGRITSYSEVGNGQILISLQGVCRFQLLDEIINNKPYRQFFIDPFLDDLDETDHSDEIDRDAFVAVLRDYLTMNDMQADWDTISQVPNEALVNALSVIVPFGPREKQTLLEARDLKTRSETMIALAQRALMKQNKGSIYKLQ